MFSGRLLPPSVLWDEPLREKPGLGVCVELGSGVSRAALVGGTDKDVAVDGVGRLAGDGAGEREAKVAEGGWIGDEMAEPVSVGAALFRDVTIGLSPLADEVLP